MRNIGNVERILVFGILVVIGLILAVAVKGARDVEQALQEEFPEAHAKAVTDPSTESSDPSAGSQPHLSREGTRSDPKKGGRKKPQMRPGKPEGAAPQKTTQQPAGGADGVLTVRDLDRSVAERLRKIQQTWDGRPGSQPAEAVRPAVDLTAQAKKKREPTSAAHEPARVEDRPTSRVPSQAQQKIQRPTVTNASDGSSDPAPNRTGLSVGKHTVQKGDTLEGIALATLGKASLWKEILAANPKISDPRKIRPGMVLQLPGQGAHSRPARQELAKAEGSKPALQRSPAEETSPRYRRITGHGTYRVRKGDTLMQIALAHYGSKSAWRQILAANRAMVPNQNRIRAGQVLQLP
jgi:nucleoid-associated protein YgaU